MNWGDMRTIIRTKLRDPNALLWTNAELLEYANTTIENLTRGSESHTKHIIFSLTSGTRSYTLPEDCFEIREVKINSEKITGIQAYELEEMDEEYLVVTGVPEYYYQEDSRTIAFYRVPSWTSSYTSFVSEFGEVTQINDGTNNFEADSEFGCVTDILSSDPSNPYQLDNLMGEVIALDSEKLVCTLSYIYQPTYLVDDTTTPDLLAPYQWLLIYDTLDQAFSREGQGQNKRLASRYGLRYKELETEFFARSKEWAHGPDQLSSMQPMGYRTHSDQWRRTE